MALSPQSVQAVVFDYGNTLIEFGPRQLSRQYDTLSRILCERFGHCDRARLKDVRDRQLIAPYRNGYRENDLREIACELIRELEPDARPEDHADALIAGRYQAFLDSVHVRCDVAELLLTLRRRFRLALLSNYPCSASIRDSLAKNDIATLFDAVVVSADIGYVKPHPDPFRRVLEELGLPPDACVFVGDNWLADVQGAKRTGMQAVLTTEYRPYERFDPEPNDFEPDARIAQLSELPALLADDGEGVRP
jgi:HAD superfamily hydrolase (TIGR01509 family)